VLDWSASSLLATSRDVREKMLGDAANAAERALILNPQNALALVYLAEVQLDQQSWVQSQQTIEAALELDATLMDAHRVHGIVLESLGQYRAAIEAYERAAAIAPNLTFLYIYIGLNYRNLQVYDRALEFFDRAAQINTQNGVEDPLPYIAISKTYSQQGEFFIASRNAERAVSIDPYNANTYGQLGIIYVKARNYEGALPVLACVVYGCSAADNEVAGVDVTGLPLSNIEVAYYYLQYGSVLAALNQCPAAAPVLDMVENAYGSDPVIASIIAENEEICRRLEAADSQGG
jgi:tetratricopeptide (TPR) repeat protein